MSPMSDVKADHMYEKFLLLFPSWEEKIERYSRKNDILVLKTRSHNQLYFWVNGSAWSLSTIKGEKGE